MLRHALRVSGLMVLSVVCLSTAWGQVYGGGGGGTTSSTTSTSKPSYGANGALIGGAAAGAVGAAVLYWMVHKTTIEGCVQSGEQGPTLQNEKDKRVYSLVADNDLLKLGERVQLQGKKGKDKSGNPLFRVGKVARDLGSCTTSATDAGPPGSNR